MLPNPAGEQLDQQQANKQQQQQHQLPQIWHTQQQPQPQQSQQQPQWQMQADMPIYSPSLLYHIYDQINPLPNQHIQQPQYQIQPQQPYIYGRTLNPNHNSNSTTSGNLTSNYANYLSYSLDLNDHSGAGLKTTSAGLSSTFYQNSSSCNTSKSYSPSHHHHSHHNHHHHHHHPSSSSRSCSTILSQFKKWNHLKRNARHLLNHHRNLIEYSIALIMISLTLITIMRFTIFSSPSSTSYLSSTQVPSLAYEQAIATSSSAAAAASTIIPNAPISSSASSSSYHPTKDLRGSDLLGMMQSNLMGAHAPTRSIYHQQQLQQPQAHHHIHQHQHLQQVALPEMPRLRQPLMGGIISQPRLIIEPTTRLSSDDPVSDDSNLDNLVVWSAWSSWSSCVDKNGICDPGRLHSRLRSCIHQITGERVDVIQCKQRFNIMDQELELEVCSRTCELQQQFASGSLNQPASSYQSDAPSMNNAAGPAALSIDPFFAGSKLSSSSSSSWHSKESSDFFAQTAYPSSIAIDSTGATDSDNNEGARPSTYNGDLFGDNNKQPIIQLDNQIACSNCTSDEICLLLISQKVPFCAKMKDRSDETGCGGWCKGPNQICQPVGSNAFKCVDDSECLPDEWRCHDNSCIPAIKRCDGHPNCYDNSDERDCPA